MKYYVYNSRCQPLSLLIEKEIQWLADAIAPEDRIIIGIVNPSPTTADPNDRPTTWARFKEAYNPLSYWERYCMIASFLKKSGLSEKVEAIVPLARPSTNMRHASNYLPDRNQRIMCLPIAQQSYEEDMKYEGMVDQGEEVFKIPSYTFPDGLDIISPELIFCLMGIGNDKWKQLVSKDVLGYLLSRNIFNRVVSKMTYRFASETLAKIYLRTVKADDKVIIADLLQGYHIEGVPDQPKPLEPSEGEKVRPEELSALEIDLKELQQEISRDLPSQDEAPEAYVVFDAVKKKISEYLLLISSDKNIDMQKYQKISDYYKEVKAKWQQAIK
jgi:hypothetical protein